MDPDNLTMRWNLACALTSQLKDYDAAIEMLESFADRMPAPLVRYLRLDTDLDPLRDNPRFEAIVAREEQRVAAAAAAAAPAISV